METISNVLFWISNGLLVPDIVLLILLFVKSLLLVGGFFGQYIGIRRTSRLVHDEMEKLEASDVEEFRKKLPEKSGMAVIEYARKLMDAGSNRPLKDRLLSEFEIYADKDMAWSRYLPGTRGPFDGRHRLHGLQHAGGVRHDRGRHGVGGHRLFHRAGQAALVPSRPDLVAVSGGYSRPGPDIRDGRGNFRSCP